MIEKLKTKNFEKSINLGVIGFNRGRTFLEIAADQFENVKPAGICDIDPSKIEIARKLFANTPVFSSLDEMLQNTDLDALIVETPANNHTTVCTKALDAGIHVLCDVPCVDNAAEGTMLYEAVKRSKPIYMSGANPNLRPTTEAMLDLNARGIFGKPYYIETEYVHDIRSLYESSPWRQFYKPIKYCTHSLGPVLELIGEEFVSVTCLSTGSHVLNRPGQHDVMSALLKTKSNIVVRLLTSFVNNYHFDGTHMIRIFGTKGSAVIKPVSGELKISSEDLQFKYATNLFHDLNVEKVLPKYQGLPGAQHHGGTDYALLERFFEAIRTGEPSPIPVEKALRMALPGIFAAESADNDGAMTMIKYPWDN